MTDTLAAVARARGLDPVFVTRRGFRDNLVQYVPTLLEVRDQTTSLEGFCGVLDRLVRERYFPDRGRGILENCIVTPRFPVE